jgi:hypothetical protein
MYAFCARSITVSHSLCHSSQHSLIFALSRLPFLPNSCTLAPDQTPANAKAILAKAVRHLPQSVKIWLRAADLEKEVISQKAVLRRGVLSFCLSLSFSSSCAHAHSHSL